MTIKNRLTALAITTTLFAPAAQAQATHLSEQVHFDCSGAIERVHTFGDGSRSAVAIIRLVIERPSSAPVATGNPGVDDQTRKLSRCVGSGLMTATLQRVQDDIPIYATQITPNRVRVQAGKLRFDNPAEVSVATTMDGNPDG